MCKLDVRRLEMQQIYVISENNLEYAKKVIEKLNKVAKKLGCADISFEVVGEDFKEVKVRNYDGTYVIDWIDGKPEYKTEIIKMLTVELTAEVPKLNGWEFIATLQHEESGTIVRTVPDVDFDASDYHNATTWCDQCKTNRLRKDTYLVRHVDDGDVKQVGSDCLKDFVGHKNAHVLMGYLEMLAEWDKGLNEAGPGGFNGGVYTLTKELLDVSCAVVRVKGWVSKLRAKEWQTPTAWEVNHILWPVTITDYIKQLRKDCAVTTIDLDKSAKIAEWVSELVPDNDYLHNLKVAVDCEYTNVRNIGIVVSAVAAYDRTQRIARDIKEVKVSEWVGEVGQKLDLDLILKHAQQIESNFGYSMLYILEDADGNVFKTFYSGMNRIDAAIGDSVKVKGTVKSHSDYNGKKDTMLTRCKFETVKVAVTV